MEGTIRIAGTVGESIVDGPGFRYTLFVQGCPHGCPGCHNPQTHDFDGGQDIALDTLLKDMCKNPFVKGVTFSGGEPFCKAEPLYRLAVELPHGGEEHRPSLPRQRKPARAGCAEVARGGCAGLGRTVQISCREADVSHKH